MYAVKTTIRYIKDKASQTALKALMNRRLESYATVVRISLDSKRKRCEVTLRLEGEEDDIVVRIEEYDVRCDAGVYTISVGRIGASRVWLKRLLQRYGTNRSFVLPEQMGRILSKMI